MVVRKIVDFLILHKKNLHAVVWGRLLAILGSFLGIRLLTEVVSPEVFGQYKLVLGGIALLHGIFIIPFSQFAMRGIHDATTWRERYKSEVRQLFAYLLVLVATLAAAILLLMGASVMSMTSLIIFGGTSLIVLQSAIALEKSLLVTQNRQTAASVVTVTIAYVLPLAMAVGVLSFGERAATMILSSVAAMLLIYYLIRRYDAGAGSATSESGEVPDRAEFIKKGFSYGAPLMAVGLFSWVVSVSDRYFLSYFSGQEAVGIYSAAYGLIAVPFVFASGTMAQFFYPLVFKAAAQQAKQQQRSMIMGMLSVAGVISAVGLCCVYFFADFIAWIALGAEYRAGAVELMPLIALGYVCLGLAMAFNLNAYGAKKTKDIAAAYGVAALTNVLLNVWLIPQYSATGAAISTAVTYAVYLLYMALAYRRQVFVYRLQHAN